MVPDRILKDLSWGEVSLWDYCSSGTALRGLPVPGTQRARNLNICIRQYGWSWGCSYWKKTFYPLTQLFCLNNLHPCRRPDTSWTLLADSSRSRGRLGTPSVTNIEKLFLLHVVAVLKMTLRFWWAIWDTEQVGSDLDVYLTNLQLIHTV